MNNNTKSFITLATELIIDGDTILSAIDKVKSLGGRFDISSVEEIVEIYNELTRRHPFANKKSEKDLVINQLFEALLEAENLFDNYPEMAKEMVGTHEVILNAISKVRG